MKRRGRSAQGRRTSFKTRVKRVLMKNSETKMYQFAEENVQLYHNQGYSQNGATIPQQIRSMLLFYNIWAEIEKGTAKFQRIGDKITPRGMSLKLWLTNKLDRPNIIYRIIVLRLPKAVGGATTGPATQDIFDTAQLDSVGNKLLLKIDNDRGFKALYDRCVRVEQGFSARIPVSSTIGAETHVLKKLWLRNKKARDITYDSTTTKQIVNNPIALYVIPYDSFGTLVTDNIASCAYYGTVYYKDV